MLWNMFIVIMAPNKAPLCVVDQRYTVKRHVGLASKRFTNLFKAKSTLNKA